MTPAEFDSLKTEAMARASWGDSKSDLRAWLMVNGASDQETEALIRYCYKQRGQQMREVGRRNLIVGISSLGGAFVLGIGAWALLDAISANGVRLPARLYGIAIAPAMLAGGFGCWQLWLALDRLVFGAHADGPVE
mgnify:CR=1 FL=1